MPTLECYTYCQRLLKNTVTVAVSKINFQIIIVNTIFFKVLC